MHLMCLFKYTNSRTAYTSNRMKLFTPKHPEGVKYRGQRDLNSLDGWIREQLSAEGRVSLIPLLRDYLLSDFGIICILTATYYFYFHH